MRCPDRYPPHLSPLREAVLPHQSQRELDLPWVARSARGLAGNGLHRIADNPKAGAAGVSIGQSEVCPVQSIEHLSPELEGFRFPQFEVANQREIPVGQIREKGYQEL